ncbi:MAG: hypothetical protein HRT87_01245 [Legionellales bacterium]|nr:hypothetical protein [Legionellales bacterium]
MEEINKMIDESKTIILIDYIDDNGETQTRVLGEDEPLKKNVGYND